MTTKLFKIIWLIEVSFLEINQVHHTCMIFIKFLCMLPMASDTLHISGFVGDVVFAHKLRLLDVAARLKR